MQNELQKCLKDSRVSAVKTAAEYTKVSDKDNDEIFRAIRQNAENLGWADEKRGAFGKVIKEGAKVLIKPISFFTPIKVRAEFCRLLHIFR